MANIDRLRRLIKGKMQGSLPWLITCREFEAFVLDYHDGTLPEDQRHTFERHLRFCRECREYLAAYRQSVEIGKSILGAPEETLPDDVPEDLIKAILDARRD